MRRILSCDANGEAECRASLRCDYLEIPWSGEEAFRHAREWVHIHAKVAVPKHRALARLEILSEYPCERSRDLVFTNDARRVSGQSPNTHALKHNRAPSKAKHTSYCADSASDSEENAKGSRRGRGVDPSPEQPLRSCMYDARSVYVTCMVLAYTRTPKHC